MSTQQDQLQTSRRDFIKTSALVSGGILFGFNFFSACKPKAKPPVDISSLNFQDFNAFIKIAENGYVSIFSPNPEIGQGVKTSMPMIIAEELDVEWEKVNVVQAAYNKTNYERQVAGGSQSIRHGWDALRQTGATCKQMLINAAAAKWGVEATTCTASKGIITNAKGEKLGYGEVALEAAALEVPEKVSLKKPSEYSIIGKEIVGVDVKNIVTGKPLFGLDYHEEGMKYACVLRPPAFGQKLESLDDAAAKAVNGVEQVLKFGDKVAVVATNTWAAFKGKRALNATWKTDSKAESTEEHDKILTGILDGRSFEVRREDGNISKAFAEADQVIERTYHSPFLPHNCLEPMNFFAHVTPEKVRLVGPIQTPAWTTSRVAKKIDRKEEEVDLQMTRMGGGFGRRLYGDFAEEAAEVSKLSGQPVKVIFTREDDMTAGTYRPAIKYRIAASIKDKKITGYHLKEASMNGSMYGLIPNFFPAGCIANYKVSTKNHKSNITTGAWRAPYTNFLAYAEQSFFDELAEAMEVDAVQLRLDLLQNVKDTKDEKIEYSGPRMIETIKLAAAKGGWGKAKAGVFQGFAAYYSHNTHVAELAEVELRDGKPVITKVVAAVDCGIVVNLSGAINQVQGGVIDGLGHAMYGDFGFKDGVPTHKNFDSYRLIRMNETPQVEVHFVQNELSPTGLGEPGLPPAGGAVANALFKALGKRIYAQPFIKALENNTLAEG